MNDKSKIAREYYLRIDAGRADIHDLFTDDVELYFPKFGVARGKGSFDRLLSGLSRSIKSFAHNLDGLRMVESGDMLVVEGTTFGELLDGTKWSGGETPGGRFASVFSFKGDLISRMYIYLDPDYGSHDADRFLWPDLEGQQW